MRNVIRFSKTLLVLYLVFPWINSLNSWMLENHRYAALIGNSPIAPMPVRNTVRALTKQVMQTPYKCQCCDLWHAHNGLKALDCAVLGLNSFSRNPESLRKQYLEEGCFVSSYIDLRESLGSRLSLYCSFGLLLVSVCFSRADAGRRWPQTFPNSGMNDSPEDRLGYFTNLRDFFRAWLGTEFFNAKLEKTIHSGESDYRRFIKKNRKGFAFVVKVRLLFQVFIILFLSLSPLHKIISWFYKK